jgi:hypothetical protein
MCTRNLPQPLSGLGTFLPRTPKVVPGAALFPGTTIGLTAVSPLGKTGGVKTSAQRGKTRNEMPDGVSCVIAATVFEVDNTFCFETHHSARRWRFFRAQWWAVAGNLCEVRWSANHEADEKGATIRFGSRGPIENQKSPRKS